MGTDIHLYVEKRNANTKKWEIIKGVNPRIELYREWSKQASEKGQLDKASEYKENAASIESNELVKAKLTKLEKEYPLEKREHNSEVETEYLLKFAEISDYDGAECFTDWVYDGRNYDLFAILANVRNGFGFGGCDTGNGFMPISESKGVPMDASEFVQRKNEEWDGDGHSHSYLTVKELVEYNWDQTTKKRGVVSEHGYKHWKEVGYPEMSSGGVSGGGAVNISNEQMEQVISGSYPKKTDEKYYTTVEWEETCKEAADNFYAKSLETLKDLANETLDDVRIVFWFDN